MKMKRNLVVAAGHVLALVGFSLLQGCATGECPVCWMNWPYNTPVDVPAVTPTDQPAVAIDEDIFLPPIAPEPLPEVIELTPEPPPPVAKPSVPDHIYVVQKGDTLSDVAARYGTTWKKLADYNQLSNPNKLLPKQELRIPGTLSEQSVSSWKKKVSSSSGKKTSSTRSHSIRQGSSYVIQKGDTLSGIAKRAGLSVSEIKAANALNNSVIVAGKSLSIPKKGEVKTHSAPKPKKKTSAPAKPASTPSSTLSRKVKSSSPAPAPLAGIAPVKSETQPTVYDHVLYPGESLEDVARQYGSSQEEIMKLNGITDPTAVKAGSKLLVPIPE